MANIFDFFAKKKIITDREIGRLGTKSLPVMSLPDGTKYNTDDISITVYRKMKLDPQISACLNVIKFTMQKIDWYVEGDDKAKKVVTESFENVWNQLIAATSKALWAGYSPNTKVFTLSNGRIVLKKIRDLDPNSCRVKTDSDGNFNGFIQTFGASTEIVTPKYAFWYAHQMENGNLYGNSMIKPAYKPWYYSELLHLFANRYYERFGEPVVMGRAPAGETIEDNNGNKKDASQEIQNTINNIRNHASLTIPSDRDDKGNFLFDVSYLESQMRGVDFDIYMKRLDMEKARAIFVPDLLLGSGNVGSYALGLEHKATFITGIMGMINDMFGFFNKYIVRQLVELNYPSQTAKLKYTPLSRVTEDAIMNIVRDMVNNGVVTPDTQALSERIGIPLSEPEEKPIEKPIKEIAKKQMERVRNYLSKALLSDNKIAINNLKIGYPEAFNSEAAYHILEAEVRNKVKSCVSMNYDIDKIMLEVGRTLGIEDRKEINTIIKEEARKILEEEGGEE